MLALCAHILIWVSVLVEKAQNAPYFGPFSNRAKKGTLGFFLQIRSAKLKYEHTAPTFQPLASGLTPHMHMFGCHEIFTF